MLCVVPCLEFLSALNITKRTMMECLKFIQHIVFVFPPPPLKMLLSLRSDTFKRICCCD